ncbi:caspase domain-domain-containing protein [Kockovaella imperatae]|uniref:Caspase domain-domain-containing protein n=1 Tax=Kockovaella imperatae TaxID=4999 RepID=A0A1Y1UBH0_9TREE|nr:caspase domain-domain-containing protein [Kockovaella imperatae]ORX34836.1 caspase domain-domain-containing protein [Kockovaella imperatae]
MSWSSFPGQSQHGQYSNNPPPPQWGQAPPPPNYGYNSLGQNQYYPPPPTQYNAPPPPHQGGGGWAPPTGAPPPQQYHQTAAGYRPPNESQQGQGAPFGPPPSEPGAPYTLRPPTQQQQYGPQFQNGGGGQSRPFFQYSQCTGRRKALCIGINYFGSSSQLAGCINDARNVQKFLIERYQYRPEDIVMLTDDAQNPRQIPTRANMIQAMQWLVAGAQPNDALFFHYSGHGGQTKDLDGDEDDGYDEVIYPVDFKQSGHIVDDDSDTNRHEIMVRPLPPGCRLTAIFDSCHSGSCLDLPYIYSTEGVIKEPNLLAEAGQGILGAGMSYLRGDLGGAISGVFSLGKQMMNQNSGARERTIQSKTSPADVVMWSGCKDSQTSADTQEAGRATGAMSYAFIAALTKYPQQSYVQLLNTIRDELRGRYDQKPQLSASHPMDTNVLFIC